MDKILGHYYQRGQIVRFRAESKDFNILSILSLEEVMHQQPALTKEYLLTLSTKAINTLIRRHPQVLDLLRKDVK